MYLLVFVFMMVSLMGLYLETFSIEAAHMFAAQKGVAEVLFEWHGAAFRTVNKNLNTFLSCGAGQLSPNSSWGAACGSIRINTTPATNDTYYLPIGYNLTYEWPSYFYTDAAGNHLLLTFIAPPASGDISAPLVDASDINRPPIGFSVSQVYRQMKNMKAGSVFFGYAKSGVFYTPTLVGDSPGMQLTFPLPTSLAPNVPDGSVGYISVI